MLAPDGILPSSSACRLGLALTRRPALKREMKRLSFVGGVVGPTARSTGSTILSTTSIVSSCDLVTWVIINFLELMVKFALSNLFKPYYFQLVATLTGASVALNEYSNIGILSTPRRIVGYTLTRLSHSNLVSDISIKHYLRNFVSVHQHLRWYEQRFLTSGRDPKSGYGWYWDGSWDYKKNYLNCRAMEY